MDFQTTEAKVGSFAEMPIDSNLVSFLKHRGIAKPTEVQSRALPLALQGHDLIAIAQTGSGKTMAFAIPILERLAKKAEARAIIFVPSREMAQQIAKVFTDISLLSGIEPCVIIGGTPNDKQVSALRKSPRLIIATPGRMNDHLITNKLLLKGVEVVVLDEADRMLDMGFGPQLESVRKTLRGERQTMMFSASFNDNVAKSAASFFLQKPFMIRTENAQEPVEQLKQKIIFLKKNSKNEQLIIELNQIKKSAIIFTADQQRCESIGHYLQANGFKCDLVHGGMTQGHRNRVVREFREGKTRFLVATDLLARGLDVEQVGAVINIDLPFNPDDFLHRIGRTARAGRFGRAITFVTALDKDRFEPIKPYLEGAEEVHLEGKFKFDDRKNKYPKSNKDNL